MESRVQHHWARRAADMGDVQLAQKPVYATCTGRD